MEAMLVKYKSLGRTGLKVSRLCLGTMNFGSPTEEKASLEIVDRYVSEGGNFIDTANVYNHGVSEEIVGKALRGRRDSVVLATKVHGKMGPGPNDQGNGKKHIISEVEKSLKRLNTDYIDLYWIHRPDPTTPVEETLEALDYLVNRGYVRFVGTSTFPAWQIVEALWTSERRNLVRFSAEQPPYSIIERQIEARILPTAERFGLGIVSWSPLAGGWLAGRYRRDRDVPEGSRVSKHPEWSDMAIETQFAERRFQVVDEIEKTAKELGVSMATVSLAWVLSNPLVTAPIIGPRTAEHLEDYLKACEIELPEEFIARIDELVPPGTSIWQRVNPSFVI